MAARGGWRARVVGGEDFRARLSAAELKIHEGALQAVNRATRAALSVVRGHVNAAFPGSMRVRGGNRRVANAIRSVVYDNGERGIAGLIYSKFGRGRGAAFVDFVLPRLEGVVIVPRRGQYLVIDLPAAGGVGLRMRASLARLGASQKLDWVPIEGGRVLVVDRRTRTPLYLLVKRVAFPARIGRGALVREAARSFPAEAIAAITARIRELRV